MEDTGSTPAFLAACRGEPHATVPVWFMRQAGRSLPEYRAVRGDGSILDAIAKPDVAAEISLQPVRRYGVDAAILYSDIVVPVAAIGFGVDVAPGTGPVVARPFQGAADLERLRPLEPEADTPYVLETVRTLVKELPVSVPVIGFAGAPFTVASYLVEGGPSRTYGKTKAMLLGDPVLFGRLLDRLAHLAADSIASQVAAGARAFQLFDSWAGALTPAQYERHVLPHSRTVFSCLAELGVPGIHFGVNTGELLGLLGDAGADVVGVDWRTPLSVARARVGAERALQGNLDPAVCLGPWEAVEAEVRAVLAENGGHPGHVFNLGHGVLPETDPSVLERVVELVHREGDGPVVSETGGRTSGGVGVVVMAYGTPGSLADVEAYYTHIRRGRAPEPHLLAALQDRYRSLGGTSPFRAITEAQAALIRAALSDGFVVATGQKHAPPFIEDAVAELAGGGAERVVGVTLAPHYSEGSVGQYIERLAAAADTHGLPWQAVESWQDLPELRAFLVDAVRDGLARLPSRTKVVFTAHSLPERVLAGGDPYPDELRDSATAVAQAAGLDRWAGWTIAWQSAGRTAEAWRGPDILEVLTDLAGTGRADGVLVCPQGFVADHLEVLYDLDQQAAARAAELGLAFARTRSLNDDETVLTALAERVRLLAEAP